MVATSKQLLISPAGMKTISIGEFDAWLDVKMQEELGGVGDTSIQQVYRTVPWLFRGVDLIGQAVAALPFELMKGTAVYDKSDDWKNKVGFLPNPRALFETIAASLTFGRCYLFAERNRMGITDLRYLVFTNIKPVITAEGLQSFKRTLNGRTYDIKPEDMIYFWLHDTFVELGEPKAYPAMAAMAAAGVLANLDAFVAAFFKRGAIKATLLTVDGNMTPQDKEKTKAWWSRMFTGIRSAWTTEIVNSKVAPVVVGEGVKELENNVLSEQTQKDICVALGIPISLLFSDASTNATAGQDELHWYNKKVIPLSNLIADTFNEQIFDAMGLKLAFKPETLEAFQEHENQRMQALVSLVSALGPEYRGLAMQMLGFILPEGYTFEQFNQKPAEPLTLGAPSKDQAALAAQEGGSDVTEKAPNTAPTAPGKMVITKPQPQQLTPGMDALKDMERGQYRKWATNAKRKAGDAFEFKYLTLIEQEVLTAEAQGGGTPPPFQSVTYNNYP